MKKFASKINSRLEADADSMETCIMYIMKNKIGKQERIPTKNDGAQKKYKMIQEVK